MKTSMACTLLAAALVCVTPLDSLAQVRQSGNVTPGHIATWTTTGVIQDGGGAVPSVVIPTVANDGACFSNTTGTLVDCGGPPVLNSNPVLTGRWTWTTTPTYNLAANLLGTAIFLPLNATTQTIPAGDEFDYIRGTNLDGTDVVWTLGNGSTISGTYFSITSGAGSNANSNIYSGVFHSHVLGPNNGRALHLGAYGCLTPPCTNLSTGGTGVVSGAGVDLQPTTGLSAAYGVFVSLNSSGVNGIGVGYDIESGGDTYNIGFGSIVNPVSYVNAAYRAWMGSGSATNARAFQVLNNAGTELAYWLKDGNILAPTLTLSQNAATPTLPPPNLASLWLINLDGSGATAFVDAYTNQAGGTGSTVISPLIIFRAANGTLASPSQLGATSVIGVFGARTYTSSSTFTSANVARIAFQTFNAQTNTDNSSLITLETTPSGSTTRAVAMTIQPSGGVSVGAAAADPGIGAINATNGYKSGGSAGVSTTCTVTAGNTLVFTGGILTSKGANCT